MMNKKMKKKALMAAMAVVMGGTAITTISSLASKKFNYSYSFSEEKTSTEATTVEDSNGR